MVPVWRHEMCGACAVTKVIRNNLDLRHIHVKKSAVKINWSKCKIVLAHVMNTYRWSRSTVALTLNLGTRQRWVAIFTFRLLFFRKRTPTTTEKEVERDPDLVWTVLKERKPLSHAGIQTTEPSSPAANRYTDYVIPAQKMNCDCGNWLKVLADDHEICRYANWKRLCWGHFQSTPNTFCTLPLHSPFPLKTLDVPQILCQICQSQSHKITQL
jgi:hypothetical protein